MTERHSPTLDHAGLKQDIADWLSANVAGDLGNIDVAAASQRAIEIVHAHRLEMPGDVALLTATLRNHPPPKEAAPGRPTTPRELLGGRAPVQAVRQPADGADQHPFDSPTDNRLGPAETTWHS